MCLGLPMQVMESHEFCALCEHRGEQQSVDTTLVGQRAVGDWVLVFLGTAREVLNVEQATEICNALDAVGSVMSGKQHIDHLFADLVDREPQLPLHLLPK